MNLELRFGSMQSLRRRNTHLSRIQHPLGPDRQGPLRSLTLVAQNIQPLAQVHELKRQDNNLIGLAPLERQADARTKPVERASLHNPTLTGSGRTHWRQPLQTDARALLSERLHGVCRPPFFRPDPSRLGSTSIMRFQHLTQCWHEPIQPTLCQPQHKRFARFALTQQLDAILYGNKTCGKFLQPDHRSHDNRASAKNPVWLPLSISLPLCGKTCD